MVKVNELVWRGRAGGGLLVVGLMLASACAAEDDLDGGDGGDGGNGGNAPIAELALTNGSTVQFYEPEPGAIAIAQEAAIGVELAPIRNRTAVEVFESLAPDQPVPPALLAAQARAAEAHAGRLLSPDDVGSVAPTGPQSITNAAFISSYCTGSFSVLLCALVQTASRSSSEPSVYQAHYVACANVGDVTLRTRIDGGLLNVSVVPDGQCLSYHWTSAWFDQSAFGEVVNVDPGDRYDFAARYYY